MDKFKEQNLDYMPLGRKRHPTESWRQSKSTQRTNLSVPTIGLEWGIKGITSRVQTAECALHKPTKEDTQINTYTYILKNKHKKNNMAFVIRKLV